MITETAQPRLVCGTLTTTSLGLPDSMVRRPIRVTLLSLAGVLGLCLALVLPLAHRGNSGDFTKEEATQGRWIASGNKESSLHLESPFGRKTRSGRSLRELDRTVQRLEEIVFDNPVDISARSNLACALLARDQERNRPVDLVRALEQLELAMKLDPHKPEVLYNQALALTRLGLRSSAVRAWERYLDSESEEPWAEIAQRWREELRQPTLFERWESGGREHLRRTALSGDQAGATELVATFPALSRLWIEEELLPARKVSASPKAEAGTVVEINALRVLGRALAEVIKDRTVEDTLALLDRSSGPPRQLLLEGLDLYRQGMVEYRRFGPEERKNDLLERAGRALERAGSPLYRWALFYRAIGWHRTAPDVAFRELSKLAAGAPPDQPALAARIHWMLGTNEETQNHYEPALRHYERARDFMAASEGPDAAAFIDLLTAEALSRLGEGERSWEARVAAIRKLNRAGERQRVHSALYSTVEQLFLERRFATAQAWVEELEANKDRWSAVPAPALVEVALQKARLLAKDGHAREAEASFREARRAATQVEDLSLRSRQAATIDLYEAESLLDINSPSAERNLGRARNEMLEIGYRYQLPRLDSAMALAYLGQGDQERALEAFRSSIAEEERIRREVRDETLRASAFEAAQQAFDALVKLELDSGHGERAFGYAEQARARALLDLLANDLPSASNRHAPVDMNRLAAELPSGVDLLEMSVLSDRLVVWWIRRGSSQFYQKRINPQDLERSVEQLRRAISRDGGEEAVQVWASQLWRELLGPVEGQFQPGSQLVIVPDRFLGRIPFAALFNPDSQRYLIEDYQVIIAPSASAFLAAEARRRALGDRSPSSVLAVGANHPGETWLPTVEGEALSIGSLYPQSEVLIGDDATRTAFYKAGLGVNVIHFAGHAKDDLVAARRSRLLFHPEGSDDSGFLLSEEIANRPFPRARLAVLAACRSVQADARGRETVSGVAAAFLAAGVPSVIASLWNVDDRATGDLMVALHRNLRRGFGPGAALRAAQLEMLGPESRFRSPRYWAGFIAIGAD